MSVTYTLERVNSIPADIFARLIRTRFIDSIEDAREFRKVYQPSTDVDRLLDSWADVVPFEVTDNADPWFTPIMHRRLLFWAIRPERFFPQCNPKLLWHYEDEVTEPIWTRDGTPNGNRKRKREYNIYSVEKDLLGVDMAFSDCAFTLQCWCPSTGKEHWMLLPQIYDPAMLPGSDRPELVYTPRTAVNNALCYVFFGYTSRWSNDAMRRLSGKYLYRQGDVLYGVPDPKAPVYSPGYSHRSDAGYPVADVLSHLLTEA